MADPNNPLMSKALAQYNEGKKAQARPLPLEKALDSPNMASELFVLRDNNERVLAVALKHDARDVILVQAQDGVAVQATNDGLTATYNGVAKEWQPVAPGDKFRTLEYDQGRKVIFEAASPEASLDLQNYNSKERLNVSLHPLSAEHSGAATTLIGANTKNVNVDARGMGASQSSADTPVFRIPASVLPYSGASSSRDDNGMPATDLRIGQAGESVDVKLGSAKAGEVSNYQFLVHDQNTGRSRAFGMTLNDKGEEGRATITAAMSGPSILERMSEPDKYRNNVEPAVSGRDSMVANLRTAMEYINQGAAQGKAR